MKMKRDYAGMYSCFYKGWYIEVYKAEYGNYWSSTLEYNKYPKPGWKREVIQLDKDQYGKKELVEHIQHLIDNNLI